MSAGDDNAENKAGEYSRVMPARLGAFLTRCYQEAGLDGSSAASIAELIVDTELRGVATHGAIRVPAYIARLRAGGLNPNPKMTVKSEAPATAVLFADNAPGHLSGKRAMDLAVEKAATSGIGAVAVKDSDHFGANGTFAMLAAKQDMIGMVWSNSFPIMSAWGGYGDHLTNGPFACAIPAGKKPAILLDIAMSKISTGAVRIASQRGESLHGKPILDGQGYATNDPNELLSGGSHMSIGGHKGYGFAIISEVLSGILAGGPFLSAIPLWDRDPTKPSGTGHFVLAINIRHFIDPKVFKARVDVFIEELTAHPPRPGFSSVRVPGADAAKKYDEYELYGIPVHAETIKSLYILSRELGLGEYAL
ncbi:MAG: Ldh family oxidoreductase [Pseudomonadota bacterium]